MSITVQLLGRPRITRAAGDVYKFRSRKSWGLLAYLILSEHAPARRQLASLLFAGADDPVRALRWCLAEIRRALGEGGSWAAGFLRHAFARACQLGDPCWEGMAGRGLASRAGMRELALRSLRHGAALGNEGDAVAATVLAEEIEVHEHRDPPAGVSLRS